MTFAADDDHHKMENIILCFNLRFEIKYPVKYDISYGLYFSKKEECNIYCCIYCKNKNYDLHIWFDLLFIRAKAEQLFDDLKLRNQIQINSMFDYTIYENINWCFL